MSTDRPAPPTRRRVALIGVLAALALIALACGSSKKTDAGAGDTTSSTAASTSTPAGDDYGAKSTSSSAPSGATGGTSIAVGTTSLGQVVVDAQGFTLYLFEKDTGPTSTCSDACAKAWPPATVTGAPTAGTGVTGALTTTTRADGTTQIVLAGHPLYRFAADAAPGDVTGQGVGGTWYVVSPSGQAVE